MDTQILADLRNANIQYLETDLHYAFHFDNSVYLTIYSRTGYDFMDGARFLCYSNDAIRLSRLVGEYLSCMDGYDEEIKTGNIHFLAYYWKRIVSIVTRLENQYPEALRCLDAIFPVFIPSSNGYMRKYIYLQYQNTGAIANKI